MKGLVMACYACGDVDEAVKWWRKLKGVEEDDLMGVAPVCLVHMG